MDRMIYTSMSGAKATMQRQDTLANNLANVSTVGFRAELAAFRAVPVEGSGASSRVFALESTPGYDATPGTISGTGRTLDVAMKDGAWLAVQGLDGAEAYTRGGSLDVSADGTLTTRGGLTVLGDGGPISIPENTRVAIGADGTVSTVDLSSPGAIVSTLGKLKLVNPPQAQLTKGGDGLFRMKGGATADGDDSVTLQTGAIESSNVNAVSAMVDMIDLARQFDMQMKALQSVDQNEQRASELLTSTS
jgi:flagellar basal-body rod protein FlgF